jgi:gamma-glutamyltranspeptidase/glutathione hydrolase
MRRAFRDRAEFSGDPEFVDVPVEGLLTEEYALDLMRNFDTGPSRPK